MNSSKTDKVLLVDDDENILQGYYRNLHRHFPIEIALGGESALLALENHGPFAVLVVDMRMPGMSGLELLKTVKERWPELVRIMLTGNADQATAADAVNQGEVFRFLTKPCDVVRMRTVITAALHQFYLVQAEKMLLQKTFMGSLRVLTDLLGLLDPETYGHTQKISERVRILGAAAGLETTWALEVAALLAPIGNAMLPRALATKCREGKPLTPTESSLVARVPEFGARLLENIPRLEEVAGIIRRQDLALGDGSPCAGGCPGKAESLEARILGIVSEFTRRELARKDARVVIEDMKLAPDAFDPALLALLERHLVGGITQGQGPSEHAFGLAKLREGMILARSARDLAGQVVLVSGVRLGGAHLDLLRTLHEIQNLEEPVYVLEP